MDNYFSLMGHKFIRRHSPKIIFYAIFTILLVAIPVAMVLSLSFMPWSTVNGVNVSNLDVLFYDIKLIPAIVQKQTSNPNIWKGVTYAEQFLLPFITLVETPQKIGYAFMLYGPLMNGLAFIVCSVFAVIGLIMAIKMIVLGKINHFRGPSIFATVILVFSIFYAIIPLLNFGIVSLIFKDQGVSVSNWFFPAIIAGAAIVFKIVLTCIFEYGINDHILVNSKKDLTTVQKNDFDPNLPAGAAGFESRYAEPGLGTLPGMAPTMPYGQPVYPVIYAGMPQQNNFQMPSVNPTDSNVVENQADKAANLPDYELISNGAGKMPKTKGISTRGIASNIKSIGGHAYSENLNLNSAIIPHGVAKIGIGAFANCLNLRIVVIPKSVRLIEANSFFNCRRLTRIYFDGSKKEWSTVARGSNWLTKAGTKLVICHNGTIIVNPYH